MSELPSADFYWLSRWERLQWLLVLKVIFCLAVVFIILVSSEILWRRKILRGEWSRKMVHIMVGCFVASWPWILSWRQIQLISLAMLAGVIITKNFKLLHALFNTKRRSYGEFTFAIIIGLTATITHNKAFFMIAILHMALADGLAAIIGKRYGQRWRYEVMGQQKSVVGSMTLWLVSLALVGFGLLLNSSLNSSNYYILCLTIIPPLATLVENLAIVGTDNLFLPIVVVAALQILSRF